MVPRPARKSPAPRPRRRPRCSRRLRTSSCAVRHAWRFHAGRVRDGHRSHGRSRERATPCAPAGARVHPDQHASGTHGEPVKTVMKHPWTSRPACSRRMFRAPGDAPGRTPRDGSAGVAAHTFHPRGRQNGSAASSSSGTARSTVRVGHRPATDRQGARTRGHRPVSGYRTTRPGRRRLASAGPAACWYARRFRRIAAAHANTRRFTVAATARDHGNGIRAPRARRFPARLGPDQPTGTGTRSGAGTGVTSRPVPGSASRISAASRVQSATRAEVVR